MCRMLGNISAVVALALVILTGSDRAHAQSMLIKFQQGILCDESGQVEEIISQYGQKPLEDVLVALNERTGKISCGVVNKPVFLLMEPLRIVSTPVGRMVIVKLTAISGLVQFAWRPMNKSEPEGVGV